MKAWLCFLAAALLTTMFAGGAYAKTFTVSNTNDVGAGSLRNAIAAANMYDQPNIIEITAQGTLTPAVALPPISNSQFGVTVNSNIGFTIDGSGASLPTGGSGQVTGLDTISGPVAGANPVRIDGTFDLVATLSSMSQAAAAYRVYFGDVSDLSRLAVFDDSDDNLPAAEDGIMRVLAPVSPEEGSAQVTVSVYARQGDVLLGTHPYTYIDETAPVTDGLTITSANNEINNLNLVNFPGTGLLITGGNANSNLVKNCWIGTFPVAGKQGNGGNGIEISAGASNNIIGKQGAPGLNVITGNGGNGILIDGAATQGNSIIGGAIYDNTGKAIALTNGANGDIAAPAFTSLVPVNGTAPAGATVQIFVDNAGDAELLVDTVIADGSGNFQSSVDLTSNEGLNLTATATDAAGNTSELSAPLAILFAAPVVTLNGAADVAVECGTSYTDAGASAQDAVDGDLSSQITSSVTLDGNPVAAVDPAQTGVYEITYSVTNSLQKTGTAVRTVTVADTVAPVITLLGDNPVVLELGTAYVDPGATVADVCDPAPSQIAVDATAVDVNTAGSYTVTYSALDAAGNLGTAQRTVTVEDNADTTPPEITLLGANPMSVDCNSVFTDPGATALDDADGDITDQISVSGSVDTSSSGDYTLTYSVTDAAGNGATATRTVTVLDCPVDCEDACAQEENPIDNDGDGISACLEACYGTSDAAIDTDRDGMPDNYEVDNGLNPNVNDAQNDKDGDEISNLDEFLGGSRADDADSPDRVIYVSPSGVDAAGRGTRAAPFKTIAFALSQVLPTPSQPARIILLNGTYEEDVVLKPYVTVSGQLGGSALVVGTVFGANNCKLTNLTLSNVVAGNVAILDLNNVAMRIINVTFSGLDGQATGILVRGVATVDSLIESCWFTNLSIGIDIEGLVPVIRRCVFELPATAGIVVRKGVAISEGNNIGKVSDANRGYNTFHIAPSAFAVINLDEEPLAMPNNDWGTVDIAYLNTKIVGPVNFTPLLPANSARLAPTLYVTVWEKTTQVPLTNARVSLEGEAIDAVTRNTFGVYRFTSLPKGPFTVVSEADEFITDNRPVLLSSGQRVSLIVALAPKNPKKVFPACAAGPDESADSSLGGDLALVGAILVALALATRLRRRNQQQRQ